MISKFFKHFVMWIKMEFYRNRGNSIIEQMENASNSEELEDLEMDFEEYQDKWWTLFVDYYDLEDCECAVD